MKTQKVIEQAKLCSELLYQNREQEAYKLLQQILPDLNELFQLLAGKNSENEQKLILSMINEFLTAYQLNDNLALADLLGCQLVEVMIAE